MNSTLVLFTHARFVENGTPMNFAHAWLQAILPVHVTRWLGDSTRTMDLPIVAIYSPTIPSWSMGKFAHPLRIWRQMPSSNRRASTCPRCFTDLSRNRIWDSLLVKCAGQLSRGLRFFDYCTSHPFRRVVLGVSTAPQPGGVTSFVPDGDRDEAAKGMVDFVRRLVALV